MTRTLISHTLGRHTRMTAVPRRPRPLTATAAALIMAVVMALIVALLGGCAPNPAAAPSDDPPTRAGASSAASTATPSRTPNTRVEQACGLEAPAGVAVHDVTLRATDSVRLAAAVLGSGRRGVVLLHQTDNGICGWFPYAGYLASRGYHVLLFDRRCAGNSTCPSDEAAYHHAADVDSAVADLRRRGAAKVVIVGASLGGAVAIGSCAVVHASGCVALSPAIFDLKLGGRLTATNAIHRVRVPLLVAVAPDDPDSNLDEVDTLLRRARPGVVQLVQLPLGAGHGWDTVNDPTDPTRHSPFSDQLLTFLQQQLR